MKRENLKIGLVTGMGVLAMAAAILIWQRAVQQWLESEVLENEAYDAVQQIRQLESHLAMVETDHRQYATAALQRDLRLIRERAGDASRREQWRKLELLLAEQVAQIQAKTPSDARISEQLRALLRKIGHEENMRLHQRIEHKHTQMYRTVKIVTSILVGGTMLFLCVFWLLQREVAARRAAEEKIRREHAALEKALQDLEQSHWHLDKVAEFLPICMECGKVRTAETRWETIIEYFHKNNLLFTHGLCPECAAKLRDAYPTKHPKPTGATPA